LTWSKRHRIIPMFGLFFSANPENSSRANLFKAYCLALIPVLLPALYVAYVAYALLYYFFTAVVAPPVLAFIVLILLLAIAIVIALFALLPLIAGVIVGPKRVLIWDRWLTCHLFGSSVVRGWELNIQPMPALSRRFLA
jgi:hypothetical protein